METGYFRTLEHCSSSSIQYLQISNIENFSNTSEQIVSCVNFDFCISRVPFCLELLIFSRFTFIHPSRVSCKMWENCSKEKKTFTILFLEQNLFLVSSRVLSISSLEIECECRRKLVETSKTIVSRSDPVGEMILCREKNWENSMV